MAHIRVDVVIAAEPDPEAETVDAVDEPTADPAPTDGAEGNAEPAKPATTRAKREKEEDQ